MWPCFFEMECGHIVQIMQWQCNYYLFVTQLVQGNMCRDINITQRYLHDHSITRHQSWPTSNSIFFFQLHHLCLQNALLSSCSLNLPAPQVVGGNIKCLIFCLWHFRKWGTDAASLSIWCLAVCILWAIQEGQCNVFFVGYLFVHMYVCGFMGFSA